MIFTSGAVIAGFYAFVCHVREERAARFAVRQVRDAHTEHLARQKFIALVRPSSASHSYSSAASSGAGPGTKKSPFSCDYLSLRSSGGPT